MASSASWAGCSLDGRDSLDLDQITGSFSAPITEEHAFAIVHESMKTLRSVAAAAASSSSPSSSGRQMRQLVCPGDILLHKDGRVHPATFVACGDDEGSTRRGKRGGTVCVEILLS